MELSQNVAGKVALLAIVACLATGGRAAGNPHPQQANIVFVVTDDQAPWALGAAGHPDAVTPNLDRLAREGARLTNCFAVTPVCSASRAALLTSRYPTEVGITDYLDPNRQPQRGLDPALPAWPRCLKEVGYSTALVGKWHLGHADRYHPTKFGYEEFTGFRVGGYLSKNPTVEVAGQSRQLEGWTPDILTDFAIDFIRRNQRGPFCLSLHYWAPHANTFARTPEGDRTWLPLSEADWRPFRDLDPQVPNPNYPKLDTARVKRMTREYLGSLHSVDRNLGRLFAALDRWQLADRTVVIFTSDHGYNLGHHGIWHKGNGRWILTNRRGHRPNLWDNSLRTPTIVRWPGVVDPGRLIERSITFLDWFPTLLAIGQAEPPDGASLRGRNLLPLLRGKNVAWDDDVFVQYRMWSWNQNGADLRAYRTPRWKLVRDFRHPGRDELFDLASDPRENRNLIETSTAEAQAARRRLDEKLRGIMREIRDPVLRREAGPH